MNQDIENKHSENKVIMASGQKGIALQVVLMRWLQSEKDSEQRMNSHELHIHSLEQICYLLVCSSNLSESQMSRIV